MASLIGLDYFLQPMVDVGIYLIIVELIQKLMPAVRVQFIGNICKAKLLI